MAMSRKRDLIGAALLLVGAVLGFVIDSGWLSEAVFLAFAIAGGHIAYGGRGPRYLAGLAVLVVGAVLSLMVDPGWRSLAVIVPFAIVGGVVAQRRPAA